MEFKELEEIILEFLNNDNYNKIAFLKHHNTSRLVHTLNVTACAYHFTNKFNLNVDFKSLIRGCMLHDFFLYYMLRCGFSPAKIFRLARKSFAGVYEEKVILKWLRTFYRRFFTQQFKRSCLPDGPKVGSVAVSPRGDLRMPSDACMSAWQKELDEL